MVYSVGGFLILEGIMDVNNAAIELLKAATSAESVAKSLNEVGRILSGGKTMKTIKDAVTQFNGVWPNYAHTHIIYMPEQSGMYAPFWVSSNPEWHDGYVSFSRQEFESTAKRMGYINGYEWGKEYPTNGKRPDLPDDVLIDIKCGSKYDNWLSYKDHTVLDTCWIKTAAYEVPVTSFKVVDPRYKPVDEDVACNGKNCTSNGVSAHSDDCIKEHESAYNGISDNSWHERGELPPVGVECECQGKENVGRMSFCKVKIIHYGVTTVALELMESVTRAKKGDCIVMGKESLEFRPIRTHREKVIESAMKANIHTSKQDPRDMMVAVIHKLYDAGMLVLPPKEGE